MDETIIKNEEAKRFEIHVDGNLALINYELTDKTITLVHTEVPKGLEGRGFGRNLAKYALEYTKSNGLKVVLQCPFVRSYIERQEEYKKIISE